MIIIYVRKEKNEKAKKKDAEKLEKETEMPKSSDQKQKSVPVSKHVALPQGS